jgi:hypothetical protein
MVVVSDLAKTFDVSDKLHLADPLPGWSNDHLAAAPFVIHRLPADQTRKNVMAEDLCHRPRTIDASRSGCISVGCASTATQYTVTGMIRSVKPRAGREGGFTSDSDGRE